MILLCLCEKDFVISPRLSTVVLSIIGLVENHKWHAFEIMKGSQEVNIKFTERYDEFALLSGLIIFFVTKMSYHRIIMSSVFFFIIHSYSHDKNYDKRRKWTKLIHSHDRKYYIKLTCDRQVFL